MKVEERKLNSLNQVDDESRVGMGVGAPKLGTDLFVVVPIVFATGQDEVCRGIRGGRGRANRVSRLGRGK
ncbi:UNVERIFIED_CONTAM: hypothetical protein Sradi_3839300 [Sesamum radiatum]|uniref:Uncharacterized protein n=1 Tax=Sesamum radiatum TaxID=300843 RepID=A0AAW2Q1B2_SESRA